MRPVRLHPFAPPASLGRLAVLGVATFAVLALAGAPRTLATMELPPSQAGVAVYDFADIWTPATEATAEQIADAIKARTQAEVAVVSWPSGFSHVDTDDARVDAITIINTWGVGRAGVNDGLVVLFDMDTTNRHGQIYLYGGKGFNELYLDADECQSTVDEDMLPLA
jgi:uncharacterized membrane protein YgcG